MVTISDIATLERNAVTDELRKQYADLDMVPLWESANSSFGPSSERARIWHWAQTRPVMIETLKIGLPSIVERRVVQLVNHTLPPGADATTGLMNATLQGLMPGEHARPHRHTMNALRFVVEGAPGGAVTTVNGVPCSMETGDLITTPAMTWHEHRHSGTAPTIWVDILDVYLHRVLGTAVFQPGPIIDAPAVLDRALFATANVLPEIDATASPKDSPVYRYPWQETARALQNTPQRADGSRRVRYVNPYTGGPCMSLIDCHAMQLEAGRQTDALTLRSSAVVSVIEGEGTSQIGNVTIDWKEKDTFTIPFGSIVRHTAQGNTARLFIADNREVYRRLSL